MNQMNKKFNEDVKEAMNDENTKAVIVLGITDENIQFKVFGRHGITIKEVENAVIKWACHLQHDEYKDQLPF